MHPDILHALKIEKKGIKLFSLIKYLLKFAIPFKNNLLFIEINIYRYITYT